MLLAVVPLLVIVVVTTRGERATEIVAAQQFADDVAATIAAIEARALNSARVLLGTLGTRADVLAGGPVCEATMRRALELNPQYQNLGLARADGVVVCSAVPAGVGTNIADRAYFKSALEHNDFAAGDYVVGRITGQPVLPVGYPARGPVGDPVGLLFASIDVRQIGETVSSLQLPPGGTVLILDREGTPLLDTTDPGRVGAAGADAELRRQLLARSDRPADGDVEIRDAAGIEVIAGYAALGMDQDAPAAIAVVTIPRRDVTAQAEASFRRTMWTALGAVLLGVAGALGASWFSVARPVSELVQAADRLRAGNVQTRVHARMARGPLGVVAKAFNEMADSVESHTRTLRESALTDDLTSLANRRGFEAHMQELIARGRPCGAIYLSLVAFHDVNATFGYDAGDDVLRSAAQRMGETLPQALVSRLGGDAFGCAIETGPHGTAMLGAAAERLAAAFREPFEVRGVPILVDVRVGAAAFPEHATGPELLLRRAEAAARSRQAARGSPVYDPALHESRTNNVHLIASLRTAIAEDALEMHYQPVVALADGTVRKVEALLRWPPRGDEPGHSPSDFIPVAERSGIMRSLDEWVVRQATERAGQWERAGQPMPVSVNISAPTIQDPGFPDLVARCLAGAGLSPALLTVEITETALLSSFDDAKGVCTRLKQMGIQVSLDDFGLGHSPIVYLREFPISEIKVDRSLVKDVLVDHQVAGIVQAMTDMARRLHVSTVAEGVEDVATAERMRLLGCDHAQGYIYSPAIPAAVFESMRATAPWGDR